MPEIGVHLDAWINFLDGSCAQVEQSRRRGADQHDLALQRRGVDALVQHVDC
jgi:hypothetical protein